MEVVSKAVRDEFFIGTVLVGKIANNKSTRSKDTVEKSIISANYGSVAIVAEEGLKHRNGAALTGNGETPKKSESGICPDELVWDYGSRYFRWWRSGGDWKGREQIEEWSMDECCPTDTEEQVRD